MIRRSAGVTASAVDALLGSVFAVAPAVNCSTTFGRVKKMAHPVPSATRPDAIAPAPPPFDPTALVYVSMGSV